MGTLLPALIDGSSATNTVFLPAGRHDLVTDAETITLRRGPKPAASLSAWEPVIGDAIAPADQDRLLITTHAFNPGLQASLDNEPLTPRLRVGRLDRVDVRAEGAGCAVLGTAAGVEGLEFGPDPGRFP